VPDVLEDLLDQAGIPGAVTLVTDRDGTTVRRAAGLADVESGTPMSEDALFWIASMTKSITAVLVLGLVDEGVLDLDNPVDRYIPSFRPSVLRVDPSGTTVEAVPPRSPVTLRRLLSHRAGIPYESVLERPLHDTAPITTQIQAYALSPLLHEPGSRFAYSDAGLLLAGAVAEVATATPYETLLQERLLDPLGMADTTFWPDTARLVTPYRSDASGVVSAPIEELSAPLDDRVSRYPVPGGGLFSTAADIGALCRMLLRGGEADGRRYLSETAMSEMTTAHLDPMSQAPSGPYGLGWFIGEKGSFGHGGMYGSAMRMSPADGVATVWLQQCLSTVSGESVAEFERRASNGTW
jgi:CubicO group peptidase (beta-lactamase class C family)